MDVFDAIQRQRVIEDAAENGQWLSEDQITQRVREYNQRDRDIHQRAVNQPPRPPRKPQEATRPGQPPVTYGYRPQHCSPDLTCSVKSCLRPAEYEWAYYCCTDVGERVLFRKKLCSNYSPHEAVEYEVA